MTYRRSPVLKKIGPFATALRQALEADARRPRRERRTARKLHAQLQADILDVERFEPLSATETIPPQSLANREHLTAVAAPG